MTKRFAAAATAMFILLALSTPLRVYAVQPDQQQARTLLGTQEQPQGDGEETAPEGPAPEGENGDGEGADPEVPAPEDEGGDGAAPEGSAPREVYEIRRYENDTCLFLELGEDPNTLPHTQTAWAAYEIFAIVECSIRWQYDTLDPNTPGRQLIEGEILLPDGYILQDETVTVSTAVIVFDPEGEATQRIVSCMVSDWPTPVIPRGTARDALAGFFDDLQSEAYLTTEQGDSFYCGLELDLDAINPDVLGVYYPIILDLPGGVTLEELAYYVLGVHVMEEDAVDLSAAGLSQSGYWIQWLYPAQNPVLWECVDDGEWRITDARADPMYQHPSNGYGSFLYNDASSGATGLELYFKTLSRGHSYQFQVQYESSRFSNILKLDFKTGIFPTGSSEMGGDRNGGDREENHPPQVGSGSTGPQPDNMQEVGGESILPDGEESMPESAYLLQAGDEIPPPPTDLIDIADPNGHAEETLDFGGIHGTLVPKTPAQPKRLSPLPTTPPEEYSDAYSVTVSGNRLAAIIEQNPQAVPFPQGELQISIPTVYLTGLTLEAADTLTVVLYQTDTHTFTVGLSVNERPLSWEWSEPFSVRIPWAGGTASCTIEEEDETLAILDKNTGTAVFYLQRLGTYQIKEAPAQVAALPPHSVSEYEGNDPTSEVPYSDSWVPTLSVGVIGLAAAGIYLGFTGKARQKCT